MKKVNIKSVKPVQEFVKEIEAYVKESKLDYLDAVLHYCELNSLEIETVNHDLLFLTLPIPPMIFL